MTQLTQIIQLTQVSREELEHLPLSQLDLLKDDVSDRLTDISTELAGRSLEQMKYTREQDPGKWNAYLDWRAETIREKGQLENSIRRIKTEIEKRVGVRSRILRQSAGLLFSLEAEGVLNSEESAFVSRTLRPYVERLGPPEPLET
jgi:hypothetical protein